MIKFFRKIRQNLLAENKISRYLIYAIGEIVLVVIGILIALQINNWNQEGQMRSAVTRGLVEVKNNLVVDSMAMSSTINTMKEDLRNQQSIIDELNSGILLDSSYNQKLGNCMTIRYIPITQNGYQALRAIGLENIQNKSIQNQLLRYYDIHNQYYGDEIADDRVDLLDVWLPYVRKNFKDYDYRNYAVPKSYKDLSLDSEFLVMLKINMNNRKSTLDQVTKMQTSLRSLISEISATLELRNE